MSKQAKISFINSTLVTISDRMLVEGCTPELEQALTYWTAQQMLALFS